MHKAIRYGTIIGALLLSAACENQSGAPEASSFIPRPKYVTVETASTKMTTKVTGFLYDPEAFFLSVATCQNCPFPPLLLDNSPLYLRSIITGAPMTLLDPATGGPAQIQPTVTDKDGNYNLAGVPSREDPPFLPFNPGGQYQLAPIPFPPTPIPQANKYLPTLSLRPIYTGHGGCFAIESYAMADNGILQAVANFLTNVEGTPTTVDDFVNPAKYYGVTVFWHHFPGFVFLRAPADGVTVEATSGRVINVIWAPPGVLPPALEALKSPRGFVVIPGAPTSAVGISVVLLPRDPANPTAPPPPAVKYQMQDPTENAALLRPWRLPAFTLPPAPGVITYGSIQVDYSNSQAQRTVSPSACIPRTEY